MAVRAEGRVHAALVVRVRAAQQDSARVREGLLGCDSRHRLALREGLRWVDVVADQDAGDGLVAAHVEACVRGRGYRPEMVYGNPSIFCEKDYLGLFALVINSFSTEA